MKYVITAIFLVLLIDIYYRLRQQVKVNILTEHLASLMYRYEEVLLNKKVLEKKDVQESRNAFTTNIIHRGYDKRRVHELKHLVASYHPNYVGILADIFGHQRRRNKGDTKSLIGEVEDALYMHDYENLSRLEKIVHNSVRGLKQ